MDPLKLNTVKEFGAYFTVWFDWDIDEKRFWLSGLFLPLFVKTFDIKTNISKLQPVNIATNCWILPL